MGKERRWADSFAPVVGREVDELGLHMWHCNIDFGLPNGDNGSMIEGNGLGPLWVHSPPVMLVALV